MEVEKRLETLISSVGSRLRRLRAAAVAQQVVHPEFRHQRLAVVALDAGPGGDVGILADRRAAAGAAVAIGGADLAEGATDVEPPAVLELGVDVGVERTLGGEPVEAPVLPVVEVPAQLTEHLVGIAEGEVGPGSPHLLVGLAQEADVVDLESRCAPLVRGLPDQPPPTDFRDPELEVGARERGASGVQLERPVGALIEVHVSPLRAGDRLRLAGHAAPVEGARHLVALAGEPSPRVEAGGVRAAVEPGRAARVQRAVHRRRDEPDVAVATGELLVAARHRVVRGGLQRAGGADHVVGHGVEKAEVEPVAQTAGDLGGTDDPGRLGRRLVTVLVGELRRPADAPGVEQPLSGVAVHHHDAVHREGEQSLGLHEEGPPLLEEGLEGAEVEHRGIGLDLAEVGVHGGVQQDVGRDPVLEVAADGDVLIARVAVGRRTRLVSGEHVRDDLRLAPGSPGLRAR